MSCLAAVQPALYEALIANATLGAMCSIHDEPPAEAAYPYLVIGDFTELPAHTHDKEGWEVTGMIHGWDDRKGMKRLQEILAQLDRVLLHQRFVVSGWTVSSTTREFTETLREPVDDTHIRHLVTRWRLRTLEAS